VDTEAKFSSEVVRFLRRKLVASQWRGTLACDERVKILKDFTIGRTQGRWRLIAGFQQQDIVLYAPCQSIQMTEFSSRALRINKYDKTKQKPVIIPLLICELKIGVKTNTHALITYGSISAQLKSIFPHCAYHFVMDSNRERGMKPETVLRHSKGFDRVFLNWHEEKSKVWKAVENHFKYLEEYGLLPDKKNQSQPLRSAKVS